MSALLAPSCAALVRIGADLGTVTAGTLQSNVIVAAESFTASTASFSGNVTLSGGDMFLTGGRLYPASVLTFGDLKLGRANTNTTSTGSMSFDRWLVLDMNQFASKRYVPLYST